MEAILLAGGKAERLGAAAEGRPKALIEVAGRPLAEFQVRLLVAAGVKRIIVSCAAGRGELFEQVLSGLGADIISAAEPERLGRGGGLRFAAAYRDETGPVYVLNGDELLAVDLSALLAHHRNRAAAATVTVAPLISNFGVVDVDEDDRITGFREAPTLPFWVNAGVYVFDDEALRRLPERGDHETTTFPELAREGRLTAFRHEGTWLTVNTPKDLRQAQDYVAAHPEWLSGPEGS
jgi:NDP-sugar pyrophosphorylase family protein